MRKTLSILLLALFCLPLVSPLLALAAGDEEGVPACCRRGGKHHCMAGMAGMGQDGEIARRGPAFTAPPRKCPYAPARAVATHPPLSAAPVVRSSFLPLTAHPAGVVQTESKWRIARDRSRPKRGPPERSL